MYSLSFRGVDLRICRSLGQGKQTGYYMLQQWRKRKGQKFVSGQLLIFWGLSLSSSNPHSSGSSTCMWVLGTQVCYPGIWQYGISVHAICSVAPVHVLLCLQYKRTDSSLLGKISGHYLMWHIMVCIPLHSLINSIPSVLDELKLPSNFEKLRKFFNNKLE